MDDNAQTSVENQPAMSFQSTSSRLTIEESTDDADPGLTVYTIIDDDSPLQPVNTNARHKYGRYSLPDTPLYHREHELQNKTASSFDVNSGSSSTSAVRILITDMDGYDTASVNMTTTALKMCKEVVLKPYLRLLVFISWRPFGRESYNSTRCGWQCVNIIYPICIVLLLFYTYIYEVISCQWKLNIKKDTAAVSLVTLLPLRPAKTVSSSHTNFTVGTTDLDSMKELFTPNTSYVTPATLVDMQPVCDHVVTTYVIPNLLHFVAFVLGYFYFRVHENEQLYALMEKVFLQASPLQGRVFSQSKMIRKLRFFLAFGAVWVIMTIGLQGLFLLAFGMDKSSSLSKLGEGMKWILFIIELFGIMVLNSINLAVVINFATQCEMLIFYVRGLTTRLQEKSMDLKAAMKDILMVRHSLSSLNGPMSKMTSLAVLRFAELVIMGFCILILNQRDDSRTWTYRSIFPIIWLIMMIFPLVQACRINTECSKFKQIALESRIFGYQNSSQLDLDSFLLFISQTRLKAKLFHIPMRTSYLIGIIVLTSFTLLLLLQTSYNGPASQFF